MCWHDNNRVKPCTHWQTHTRTWAEPINNLASGGSGGVSKLRPRLPMLPHLFI